ncbi:MAG TPA: helix-turn-helix domain-containing protein [Polyangiaceae bacterium]|nr:helix-turn-helix domain-containing protein [Polyangiaceae bacterium]
MSEEDPFDRLMREAEELRHRLIEERQRLALRVTEIDGQLARLSSMRNKPGRSLALVALSDPAEPALVVAERGKIRPEDIGRLGQPLNYRDLQHAVASWYGTTVAEIIGRSRFASIARARHVAVWIVHTYANPKMSSPEMGMAFGMRDHTTVLASIEKVSELLQQDPHFAAELEELQRLLHEAVKLRASRTVAQLPEPGAREGQG